MATFKYPYAVKANGRIVPPNTEIEIKDGETAETVAEKSETVAASVKKTAKKQTKKA